MNRKISLVALGIALVGGLTYFLLSATGLDKAPVSPEKLASPVSDNLPAVADPSQQDERLLTDEHTDSAVSPPQQQVPALEPEIREALSKMLNTSSEGLVEETRNGVTSVDLQGRFQTVPVATIDENGDVQITDYTHLPKTLEQP